MLGFARASYEMTGGDRQKHMRDAGAILPAKHSLLSASQPRGVSLWWCLTPCDPVDGSRASLSITSSWSLLKLVSIESLMPSNHLIPSPPSPPALEEFPGCASIGRNSQISAS